MEPDAPMILEAPLPPKSSAFKRFWRVFLARKIVVAGVSVLAMLLVLAVFAPLFAPYNPIAQNLQDSLQPPSREHLLGTDILGRDVLSRIIYGTQVSLSVGLVSVVIAGSVGMFLGLLAGAFGGWVDIVIMRCMDVMMSLPLIIMALFIGSVLGKGLGNVMLAVGIAMMPSYARLTRGQVKSIKQLDYVIASTVSGSSKMKSIFVHILPNSLSPNIVLMTMNLGSAILIEAALSFLGLGISPPMASWGSMVADGYTRLRVLPLLSIAPGTIIMLTVLAFNIVGDSLRDTLDPRLRGAL
ncbi:MAG: ABC transporter permease [Rectinemataceae bacterium]|nr:ABC transporter permease [Rectinemataceae bacterium]